MVKKSSAQIPDEKIPYNLTGAGDFEVKAPGENGVIAKDRPKSE